MTTTTHSPATATANPWMTMGWFLAVAALLGGVIAVATAADPDSTGYSPVWANLGMAFVIVGGSLAAGLLAAGAVNWQLRQQD
jgi:hypothetical protein